MITNTEYPSVLITRDVYVESFSFRIKKRTQGQNEATAKHRLEFGKTEEGYRTVKMFTEIDAEDESLHLDLVVIGVYDLQNPEKLSEDLREEVLTRNAASILMPFVRSQITLLTAQPGLSPFLLPPIDINKMVDDFKSQIKNID